MTPQLDLFSEVLNTYGAAAGNVLGNADLYKQVVRRAGLGEASLSNLVEIGKRKARHSPLTRKIRWYQQTLKQAGVLERVPGERGVWRLTTPAKKGLSQIEATVAVVGFSTKLGVAIIGACDHVFSRIDSPIPLCLTSPPYPLASSRAYGNVTEAMYVDWCYK